MAKECDKCGACCRRLLVEVYDLDVLREPHLAAADISERTRELSYDALMADLEQEGHCLVIAGGGHECKFLRGDNTCAIYPTRPNACVAMQAGDEQCQAARAQEDLPPL
jgi:Fe-S-cluster containining protein